MSKAVFDYKVVAGKLTEALDLLVGILPAEQIEDRRTEINVGEWRLALGMLCDVAYEHDYPIPARAYELIDEAGRMMMLDESKWQILQPQVLAAA